MKKRLTWSTGEKGNTENSDDEETMSEAGSDALEEFLESLSARLDAIQESLNLVLSNSHQNTPSSKSNLAKT